MKFETVDDLLRRYMSLGSMAEPKGANPVVMSGMRCASCGTGVRIDRTSQGRGRAVGRRRLVAECSDCGELWRGVEISVPRGQVDTDSSGKRISGTARDVEKRQAHFASEMIPLRRVVEEKPRTWTALEWEFAAHCAVFGLDQRVSTDRNVVEWGRNHCPRFGEWWEVERVTRSRKQFLTKIEQRARRYGLLLRRDGRRRSG